MGFRTRIRRESGGSSSGLRRRRSPVRTRIEGDSRQTTATWRNFPRSPSPDPHAEGIRGEDIRTSFAADLLVRRHFSRPDISAQYLADQADTKVRLGFVNSSGQQKGVDSLIVTDMISLARNHAIADCVLLSGDEDLRVGVQQAQEYGVRVHLLGIGPARGSQSLFLLREADSSTEWSSDVLRTFLECGPDGVEPMEVDGRSGSPAPASSHADEAVFPETDGQSDHGRTLRQVARRVADDVPPADVPSLVTHIRATNQRPSEIDGRLLAMSRNELGNDLDSEQKHEVRTAFLHALEERIGGDSGKAAE